MIPTNAPELLCAVELQKVNVLLRHGKPWKQYQ